MKDLAAVEEAVGLWRGRRGIFLRLCRAALECNANLVVVYNGKKAFWYYEQLQALVAEYPNKSITLLEFCVAAEKVGEKCSKETTKCSFCFVARNVPREEALSEY